MKNTPWTLESAAYAANLYSNGHSPKDIATAIDRTERSVISKLTQLGNYRAAPKPSREPTKAELVGVLCHRIGLDPNKVYTLTDASYEALQELIRATAP